MSRFIRNLVPFRFSPTTVLKHLYCNRRRRYARFEIRWLDEGELCRKRKDRPDRGFLRYPAQLQQTSVIFIAFGLTPLGLYQNLLRRCNDKYVKGRSLCLWSNVETRSFVVVLWPIVPFGSRAAACYVTPSSSIGLWV